MTIMTELETIALEIAESRDELHSGSAGDIVLLIREIESLRAEIAREKSQSPSPKARAA